MKTDRFGHPIDARTGYGWGEVLSSHEDEARRMLTGRSRIRDRVARLGPSSV